MHFAIIGTAGYVAPRHLQAISETGHQLVAAYDPNDSVGILDRYFPNASFFTEYERFDRHLEKLKRQGRGVDWLVVCSPNYLHDAHIRFGLRYGASVICEKPLVLNPWNVDALESIEQETGRSVFTILQLRLHPAIQALKKKIDQSPAGQVFDVNLQYITSRGKWYFTSWKGDLAKSGGIATNIGIHFFDMLIWIFGGVQQNEVHTHSYDTASGILHLEKAKVNWLLSIDRNQLPPASKEQSLTMFRSLTIDQDSFDFSTGFEKLHTRSYEQILAGNGFSLQEVRPAIEVVHHIRKTTITGTHPFDRLD